MATNDEQKAIYHVLNYLHGAGKNWLRRGLRKSTAARARAGDKYSSVSITELQTRLLHGTIKGAFDATQVLFLEPPAKEPSAAAALWCRWDYEQEPPRCGFYVGFWSLHPPFPQPPDGSDGGSHVGFVGYRFETPEVGDNHNYYHVQPCRSMGYKDDGIEAALPISSRMPTWPIAANCALELLLCMVASLYGFQGLRQLQEVLNSDPATRRNPLLQAALKALFELGWPKPAA